jgi:predicted extracellular nuclease
MKSKLLATRLADQNESSFLDATRSDQWVGSGFAIEQGPQSAVGPVPQAAPAVLEDIALVGFFSDGATASADSFAFVLLADLSGQTINFTDNGWLSAGGFRSGEGTFSYVVPAGTPIGTVVTITGGGTINLSTGGDQIIAYTGTAATPTLLYALDFANAQGWDANAADTNTSAVPTGLTAGTNALSFALDNGAYSGPLTGTRAQILANIANPANWTTNDTAAVAYPGNFTITSGAETQTAQFNPTSVTHNEGNSGTTAYSFTVTRTGGTTGQLDFSGTIAAGSTDNADYVGGTAPTTFSGSILAGQTSATVTINVAGDLTIEGDESFTLTMTTASNAAAGVTTVIGASNVGTGNITNDDATGSLSVADVSIAEGDSGTTPGTFTVTRSGGVSGTITADYTIDLPGGAGNADGTDVSATLTGSLTFLEGETSKAIAFTINGDRTVETDETFTVTLSNVVGGGVTDGTGAATITNDDVAGSVSVADVTLFEGDSGQTMATITLTRTGGSGDFTVDYATSDGSATTADVDYDATSGTAIFTGGATTVTFDVPVNGDTNFESDEAFTITLSNATGGATIGDGSATVTITNDEGPGTVSIADAQVVEGDSGTVNLVFTLTRSSGTAPFDVTVTTGDDTASDGSDYAANSQVVHFNADETTATFTVTVNGDTDVEGDETLFATLSAPTNGATIGTGTATGTITTDDFPPVGMISIADAQIVEGNSGTSLLVLTVTRTGGTRAFDVNFATANGGDPSHASASAGSDYVAQSGTLNFAAGQDTATISIVINGDTAGELSEEFKVTLSGATNGGTFTDDTAIGTIVNDDVPSGLVTIFSESFSSFTAGGFAPNPTAGQVDSDIWRVVGLSDIANPAYGFTGAAGTDFGRGIISGDPVTAGVYSVSGAGAMILQPTGAELDINGFIEARIQNTAGTTVTSFNVAFDWDYRNSADRGENMQFSYSTDGINFTAVPAAAFSTPAASAVGAVFTLQHEAVTLTGLSVANGDFLYLRWTHLSSTGSGSRDEIGIDNVTVAAQTDASLPLVSVSDVSVNEAAGTMTFTVTRFNVTTGSFTVDYATANGTATALEDYDSTSGTLSFGDNQVSATVTVNITDNAFGEADETLFLNLTNAVGANIADGQGVGTILNDDGPPITVSVNDVSVVEGQSGTSLMTFTVTRTGGSGAFDISYATADGSATAGSDYVATSGTLNFAAGENSKQVTVTINGDVDSELSETLQLVLSNGTNFAVIADGTGIGTIAADDLIYIHDIQGTAYFSPILAAEGIGTFNTASAGTVIIRAVVTAVDNDGTRQGFYLQEEFADWDANPFTSEGIYVMTRNDAGAGVAVSGVSVGDIVTVTAHVMEYQSFSNMPITVLTSSSLVVNSSGNPLPTFTLSTMPTAIMTPLQPDYTDSADGVGDTFDASLYALSYWETLEGMLVTVPDVVVADGFYTTSGGQPIFQAYSQSLTDADQINSRGGLTIAGDPPIGPPDTPETVDDTNNGGRALTDGDINPDIIEIDFSGFAIDAPPGFANTLSMGDYLGDVTGIIEFDFTDRKLFVTEIHPGDFVDHTTVQDVTLLGDDSRALTVATFNVENLDPTDPLSKFQGLAQAIANNLNMPDIISIEEMQDNNGAAAGDGIDDDPLTAGMQDTTGSDASQTWQMLVDALNAATGAHYQWVDQEPIYNAEGGEQSGNIRVGFLYNTDRVQLGNLDADATLAERRMYTDRIGDGVRDSGDLIAFSDNMLGGEINPADWGGTRRSLLGEFTFHGNTVFVTANHFPAKGGSDDFWEFNQNPANGEPTNSGWAGRNAVAQDVYAMLNHIEQNAPGVGIVSGGDYNDFYFYRPLTTVTGYTMADGTARIGGTRFHNLTLELPEAERYTYNFDGRSQAIDHIIVNGMLQAVATYDVVHLNTGFNPNNPTPLSDHDPGLSSFDFRTLSETLVGTGANDLIDVSQGGNDSVDGGAGDDGFYFGAQFTGADHVDGGAGTNDQIGLQGDYSGGLTLGANTMVNVEALVVLPGFSYNITTHDGNVAAGGVLNVQATQLAAGQGLTFNGSAETDGRFMIFGGQGNDNLTGGAGNDGFYFGPGGFTSGDIVNGGGGTNDQIGLDGDYTITLGGNFSNIEVIVLLPGPAATPNTFEITAADSLTASGQTMCIFGLQVTTVIQFNGTAETDGNLRIYGGTNGDYLIGGGGNDWIFGGAGADNLTGGLGNDVFYYDDASQSNQLVGDAIYDFASGDKIDVSGIDAVAGVGDDAFTYIGAGAFTAAGQLRVEDLGGAYLVQGDIDGDGNADFQLTFIPADAHPITSGDFVL